MEEEGFRDCARLSVSLPIGRTHVWEWTVKTDTFEEYLGLFQELKNS